MGNKTCNECVEKYALWWIITILVVLLIALPIAWLRRTTMEQPCKAGGYADIVGVYSRDYCIRMGLDGELEIEPLAVVRERIKER